MEKSYFVKVEKVELYSAVVCSQCGYNFITCLSSQLRSGVQKIQKTVGIKSSLWSIPGIQSPFADICQE